MILVDAMLIVNRAKYKLPFLKTRKDQPTGMEYGFLRLCEALERDLRHKLVLCWEGGNNFRKKIYPEYKANRKPGVKLEWSRLEEFKKFLNMLYISAYAPGFEADDAIASLVDKYKNNEQIIIWSNDKDFLQLIQKNVVVIKNYAELNRSYAWNAKTVEKKFNGLLPCELPIYYALHGDESDNIPGAPRIRSSFLQRAIVNARYAENLISAIIDFELWSAKEICSLEEFIGQGCFQRNMELTLLRRPDVIIKEPIYDEKKIKEWLTMMEFRTFRISEKVGMFDDEAEF